MSTMELEKPSSKPGRKPLTSEPKNKRTAQNRAAQRAFRERKERKMQELEDRVKMLENEKTQIVNESELLRLQVKTLMNQLSQYKKDGSTESSDSSPSDSNAMSHSSVSSISSNDNNWMSSKASPTYNRSTTMNVLNNANFKDSYDEEVFCNNLGQACGTKECPLPQSTSAGASPLLLNTIPPGSTLASTPGSGSGSGLGSAAASVSATSAMGGIGLSPSSSPFENIVTGGSLNTNTEMGFLFDEGNTAIFDNIADTNLLNDLNMYTGLEVDFDKDDVFDDLLNQSINASLISKGKEEVNKVNVNSNSNPNPNTSTNTYPVQIKKENEEGIDISEEIVPDNTLSLMGCSQIWERITSHPKFTDIDIDGLCEELKQKAKCSERGVVVNGTDVGDILKTAVKQQQNLARKSSAINGGNSFLAGW